MLTQTHPGNFFPLRSGLAVIEVWINGCDRPSIEWRGGCFGKIFIGR